MNHFKDAGYLRRREQIELERAARASHPSARRAHLGLAALYRRELANILPIVRMEMHERLAEPS